MDEGRGGGGGGVDDWGLRAAALIVEADALRTEEAVEASGCAGASLAAAAAAARGLFGWHITHSGGTRAVERRAALDRAGADSVRAYRAALVPASTSMSARERESVGRARDAGERRAAAVTHALVSTLGSPEWMEVAAGRRGARSEGPLVVVVIASKETLISATANRLRDSVVSKLRADDARLIFLLATSGRTHAERGGGDGGGDGGGQPEAALDAGDGSARESSIDEDLGELRRAFPGATTMALDAFAGSFVPFSIHVASALSGMAAGAAGGADAEVAKMPMPCTALDMTRKKVMIRSSQDVLLASFVAHDDFGEKAATTAAKETGESSWRLRATILISELGLPSGEPSFLTCSTSYGTSSVGHGEQSGATGERASSSSSSRLIERAGVTFLAALAGSQRAALLECDEDGTLRVLEAASGVTAVLRPIRDSELQNFVASSSNTNTSNVGKKASTREETPRAYLAAASGGDRSSRRSSGRSDKVVKFMTRNPRFTSKLLLNSVYDSVCTRPDTAGGGGSSSGAQTSQAGRTSSRSRLHDPSKLDVSDLQRVKRVRKLLQREAAPVSRIVEGAPVCGRRVVGESLDVHAPLSSTFLTNLCIALGIRHAAPPHAADEAVCSSLDAALAATIEPPLSKVDIGDRDDGQSRGPAAGYEGDAGDAVTSSVPSDRHGNVSRKFRAQLETAAMALGDACATSCEPGTDVHECLSRCYQSLRDGDDAMCHEESGSGLPGLADSMIELLTTASDVLAPTHPEPDRISDALQSCLAVAERDLARKYHVSGDDDDNDGLFTRQKLREYTMQIVLRLQVGKLRIRRRARDANGANRLASGNAATTAPAAKSRMSVRGRLKDPLPKPMRREIVSMVGALSFDLKPVGSDMREYCLRVLYERFRDSLPLTLEKLLVALGLELPKLQLPEQQPKPVTQDHDAPREGARLASRAAPLVETSGAATSEQQQQNPSQGGVLTLPSSTDGVSGAHVPSAAAHMHFTSFRNARNLRREVTLRVTRKPRESSTSGGNDRVRGDASLQRVGSLATVTGGHGGGEPAGPPAGTRARMAATASGSLRSHRRDFVGPTPEKDVKRPRHEVVKETPACKVQNMRKALDDIKAQRILFGTREEDF